MGEVIAGVLIIVAWIVFYVTAAIAICIHFGGFACTAFIAFFVGFVLIKAESLYG